MTYLLYHLKRLTVVFFPIESGLLVCFISKCWIQIPDEMSLWNEFVLNLTFSCSSLHLKYSFLSYSGYVKIKGLGILPSIRNLKNRNQNDFRFLRFGGKWYLCPMLANLLTFFTPIFLPSKITKIQILISFENSKIRFLNCREKSKIQLSNINKNTFFIFSSKPESYNRKKGSYEFDYSKS